MYPNVDRLVSNGNKVFVKSPTRINLFKNKNSNLSLLPVPTVAHRGSWFSAVMYYADKFDSVKSFADELDRHDDSSIEITQNLLKDRNVRNELTYISADVSCTHQVMYLTKKKKTTTNLLTETVNAIRFVESKICSLTGSKIETLIYKFKVVFGKTL